MNSCVELPENYVQTLHINLQKDKKLALIINIAALAVGIVLAVLGHLHIPIWSLLDMSGGMVVYFLRLLAFMAVQVIYILLHELTHGVVMKIFGAPKIKYGFTGLYAFAGCDCYFAKKPYIIIALAPVVLWGIVLAAVCPFLSGGWFWVFYFAQISNISGAAGDAYVTLRFSKLPKDIFVKDDGISMTIYQRGDL